MKQCILITHEMTKDWLVIQKPVGETIIMTSGAVHVWSSHKAERTTVGYGYKLAHFFK